jgi:hypothetical protein
MKIWIDGTENHRKNLPVTTDPIFKLTDSPISSILCEKELFSRDNFGHPLIPQADTSAKGWGCASANIRIVALLDRRLHCGVVHRTMDPPSTEQNHGGNRSARPNAERPSEKACFKKDAAEKS